MLPIKKISSVLTEDEYRNVIDKINSLWKMRQAFMTYDDVFKRYYLHEPRFLLNIHQRLTPIIEDTFKVKAKPSYCFLSMYERSLGICPKHIDRPQCKYSLDLCLDCEWPWPINVSENDYLLEKNEALLYSGTDHPHYRNRVDEGNYASMAFFHFVDFDFQGGLK
jgi:hypothetical protein